jgi:hypothetical protein
MEDDNIKKCDECNQQDDTVLFCYCCGLYYCEGCQPRMQFYSHHWYCTNCIINLYCKLQAYATDL